MLVKNLTEADITIEYKNIQLTIEAWKIASVSEDKGEELIRNYPNNFAEVNDVYEILPETPTETTPETPEEETQPEG